jgi:general stress protein YciG
MAENSNQQQGMNQESGNQENSGSGRGLASADQETRERVASIGGKAAHEQGTAHEWDSNEAREAGRKGGESVSQDKEHMSEIGRKGGENSHGGGRK